MLFDRLLGLGSVLERQVDVDNGFTAVETVPYGWWYSAPLPAGRLVIMLMTDADVCRARDLSQPVVWQRALAETRLTRTRVIGDAASARPHVSTAYSQRLLRRRAPGPWLSVGDASLAVDPVTGSGVVRALGGAAAADRTITEFLSTTDRSLLDDHDGRCDDETTRYLVERAQYYALETRWRDAPFWSRRLRVSA